MAENKNITNPAEETEQQGTVPQQSIPDITVRIFPVRNPRGKLVASANITLAGAFAVRGFRIYDGEKGLFVREPQQNYIKNGTELSSSTFYPVTKEAREKLYGQILESYAYVTQRNAQDMGDPMDDMDGPPELTDDDLPFEYDEPDPGPVMGM